MITIWIDNSALHTHRGWKGSSLMWIYIFLRETMPPVMWYQVLLDQLDRLKNVVGITFTLYESFDYQFIVDFNSSVGLCHLTGACALVRLCGTTIGQRWRQWRGDILHVRTSKQHQQCSQPSELPYLPFYLPYHNKYAYRLKPLILNSMLNQFLS